MITQSQIISYLNKNIDLIGERGNKTIAECPAVFKDVHTVKQNDIAIDAFNKMVELVS